MSYHTDSTSFFIFWINKLYSTAIKNQIKHLKNKYKNDSPLLKQNGIKPKL
jgi:hypothetical protein